MTEAEVAEVSRAQVATLPAAFEGFLRVAGRRCGSLWIGTDAYYPALLGLKRAAKELLLENASSFSLSDGDVVIGMHQGYNFLFMHDDGGDPAVWRYVEGGSPPVLVAEHFTALVAVALRELRA